MVLVRGTVALDVKDVHRCGILHGDRALLAAENDSWPKVAHIGIPHRKQWIIGSANELSGRGFPEHFCRIDLGSGLELRYCPDLDLAASGRNILLGAVVEADLSKPPIDIGDITPSNLEERSRSWTGHWVMILENEVHLDCLGLVTVYLPRQRVLEQSGSFAISSSPALLAKFYNLPSVDDIRPLQLSPLPPWTYRPEFRTLLAGECIDLATCQVKRVSFPALSTFDVTMDEVCERVAYLMSGAMTRLAGRYKSLHVALTAGYDTRLNLAAAISAGVPLTTFTFDKGGGYMSRADRILPPKISSLAGCRHDRIRGRIPDTSKMQAYITHAGGPVSSYAGNGLYHYSRGYWDNLRTAIDGLCFELGANYHERRLKENFDIDDVKDIGFGTDAEDFRYTNDHWEELRDRTHPFDRRDLMFWTGSCNGAYAKIVQRHALFADLIIPACNREQMALLLSVPVDERSHCRFEETITYRLWPKSRDLPYNPPEIALVRAVRRLRRIIMGRFPSYF